MAAVFVRIETVPFFIPQSVGQVPTRLRRQLTCRSMAILLSFTSGFLTVSNLSQIVELSTFSPPSFNFSEHDKVVQYSYSDTSRPS